MRRATLEKLMAARREDRPLVRALNLTNGDEKLLNPGADTSPLGQAAATAARNGVSRRVTLDDGTWLLTVYHAPSEIVIVGAVHIAQALATLGAPAGYGIRVIDPRAPYATQERFPDIALERIWPDEALTQRPLTSRSALVALAHDPKLDDEALAVALHSQAFYVGALGSARTHARRLVRLEALGFSPAELARIRGPVGLAIGARTPAEIAIAILAELVKVRRRPRRIAGIVLAAGSSSRMGRNKLVEIVHGKPMVRQVVDAAMTSRLDRVLVVTGHEADRIRTALTGLDLAIVHNESFPEGLSTSLRAGIAAVPEDYDGAMILLGDMPGISPALIDQLIAAFDPAHGSAICVATAPHGHGHPVLWGRSFFAEIQALKGDKGARDLLQTHAALVIEINPGDDASQFDIDTPDALAAYRIRPMQDQDSVC